MWKVSYFYEKVHDVCVVSLHYLNLKEVQLTGTACLG